MIGRETTELTFLAVIQLLPSRQRAVLILREVLDWPAAEVAELLDISAAAVNSALQRARATLRTHLGDGGEQATPAAGVSVAEAALLDRYIQAHESGDVELTLALIADDVRMTMPPAPYLFEGRDPILGLVERSGSAGEWRLLPTRANRQPAAACHLRGPGEATFQAFKIDVLRMGDGVICEVTTFGAKHFPAFDLPQLLS